MQTASQHSGLQRIRYGRLTKASPVALLQGFLSLRHNAGQRLRLLVGEQGHQRLAELTGDEWESRRHQTGNGAGVCFAKVNLRLGLRLQFSRPKDGAQRLGGASALPQAGPLTLLE